MKAPPQASRPSPPQVDPVEHDGVRYEQDDFDVTAGDQRGGYLAAIDSETGEKLWRLKVYEVEDTSPESVPSFARYFRSMRLVPGRDELEIEDESGGRYLVDLNARTSTETYSPEQDAEPEPPDAKRPERPE